MERTRVRRAAVQSTNKPRAVVVWWARPLPELVRVEQLAHMISWSERSIWRAVARKELPAPLAKPLRPRLWRTADIVSWTEAESVRRSKPEHQTTCRNERHSRRSTNTNNVEHEERVTMPCTKRHNQAHHQQTNSTCPGNG
jgi:predicted DNA-binding transcriptional regulator AlpA